MQIPHVLFVTSLYITCILASTNINTFGSGNSDHNRELSQRASHGDNRAKATKALRDHHSFFGIRDRHADAGSKYFGSAGDFGQNSAHSSAHGNIAAQNFAKQDSKFDDIARQIAAASKAQGYQSASEGKYDKVDDNRARGYNSAAQKGSKYNRGKVFNDNIEYGFNKDFKQDLSERGGFEEEQGHKKHKLDEYKDKQKAHKLIKGDHTAANAREDAQRALKESKYSNKAAQRQADNAKFGNSEKKLDKAGATQDAQSVLFDRADSKSSAENKGHQLATNQAKKFANKDNAFGRQAAASHAGAQGHADKKYYGGHGTDGIHGGDGSGGAGPHLKGTGVGGHEKGSGGLANHKYGEQANQSDKGKEHLSQVAGASDQALKKYDQSKNKQDFKQIKSLHDQRKGKFAQGVHNAEKNGFHAKNSHADKSAKGDDRKYADATAKSKALAAKHDLDEELFDKENHKKRLHDDNETFRKVKKFYHDKKSGGKNIERLKYNRKRIENEFGNFQSAQNDKQNQFDNNHKAAKHHAAARSDNFQDARKTSLGFAHHASDKAQFGESNNRAAAFNKGAKSHYGNKKQISESDSSNHKDDFKKKVNQLSDHKSDAVSIKGNGFRNAEGFVGESKGGPVVEGNVLGNVGPQQSGAHRGYSSAPAQDLIVHDTPHASQDVHIVPHQGGQTGGYGNNNNKAHLGTVRGDDFGKFGDLHNQRRINDNSHGQSGYSSGNNVHGQSGLVGGSDTIHQIGGLFNRGSFDHGINRQASKSDLHSNFGGLQGSKSGLHSNFGGGLFGNFGSSFGQGSSKFGNTYASHSGARNSVSHSGGLFNSPFGRSSFGRSGSLFNSRFKFGGKSKGILF